MANFEDLREQTKAWLKKMFVPQDVSLESLLNTGVGQAAITGGIAANPQNLIAINSLMELAKSPMVKSAVNHPTVQDIWKNVMTMADATGPGGSSIDNVIDAGIKAGPAAINKLAKYVPEMMAVVPPMFTNLGRMKPRGVPARPSEIWHSTVAEELDKRFIAPGNPEDLISKKEVKAFLNKLPGFGVSDKIMKHFDLAKRMDDIKEERISRQDLADLVDTKIPAIDITKDASQHRQYHIDSLPFNQKDITNYIIQTLDPTDVKGSRIPNPMVDPTQNNVSMKHWPRHPNTLGHIRSNQSLIDGEGNPIKYFDEAQSDWQRKSPETFPLDDTNNLFASAMAKLANEEGWSDYYISPSAPHIDRWGGHKTFYPGKKIESTYDLWGYVNQPNKKVSITDPDINEYLTIQSAFNNIDKEFNQLSKDHKLAYVYNKNINPTLEDEDYYHQLAKNEEEKNLMDFLRSEDLFKLDSYDKTLEEKSNKFLNQYRKKLVDLYDIMNKDFNRHITNSYELNNFLYWADNLNTGRNDPSFMTDNLDFKDLIENFFSGYRSHFYKDKQLNPDKYKYNTLYKEKLNELSQHPLAEERKKLQKIYSDIKKTVEAKLKSGELNLKYPDQIESNNWEGYVNVYDKGLPKATQKLLKQADPGASLAGRDVYESMEPEFDELSHMFQEPVTNPIRNIVNNYNRSINHQIGTGSRQKIPITEGLTPTKVSLTPGALDWKTFPLLGIPAAAMLSNTSDEDDMFNYMKQRSLNKLNSQY